LRSPIDVSEFRGRHRHLVSLREKSFFDAVPPTPRPPSNYSNLLLLQAVHSQYCASYPCRVPESRGNPGISVPGWIVLMKCTDPPVIDDTLSEAGGECIFAKCKGPGRRRCAGPSVGFRLQV